MNPYYGSGYGPSGVVATSGAAAPVYDYSQPINTVAPPPETAVADDAMATFDAAREAFKQGNYADAVAKADAALAKLPNDAAIHEFRALCLFALKRYDEAAATLYSVLAVGPGWDWATLISLYPSVDVYTSQLRAAEDYCRANPKSASARFVLAYQYLTEGHTDVAVKTLKDVLALNSNDALAAKLVRQLDPSAQPATVAAAPVSAPPQGASLSGTWKAQPNPDTTIELNAQPDGRFTWKVTRAGKTQDFAGTYAYRDGVLTLTQDNGPVLVGRVNWNDPTHMAFHVVGEGPQDPGLTFAKA
jgi:tetratricopeptide (TPR) repeat protein